MAIIWKPIIIIVGFIIAILIIVCVLFVAAVLIAFGEIVAETVKLLWGRKNKKGGGLWLS